MENVSFKKIQGLLFCSYSPDEIKKLSVLEVTNLNAFDALGHPTVGSLYDLSLGPNDRDEFCATCGLNFNRCPGHIGHISLPVPVYSPVFLSRLYQLLRGSCFYCHRLLAPPIALYLALYQLQALDYGLVSLVQELEETVSEGNEEIVSYEDSAMTVQQKLKEKFEKAINDPLLKDARGHSLVKSVVDCRRIIIKKFTKDHMMGAKGKCPHCKMNRLKLTLRYNCRIICVGGKKFTLNTGRKEEMNEEENIDVNMLQGEEDQNEELTPLEAKKHLHLLWENDKVFMQNFYKTLCQEENFHGHPTDMFFMEVIVVPPSRFRRLMFVKGKKYLNPQSVAFGKVLEDCATVRNVLKVLKEIQVEAAERDMVNKLPGKSNLEKLCNSWVQLQMHVNEIFDSDLNKLSKNKSTSFGIKQILEKKEGLFRKNMMGKRVNYAARSVISPDPYIMVNEIGIPMVFATKLTFPEPVSHWNVERLRKAVLNGPNVHPGAVLIENEDGNIVKLSATDFSARRAIANTLLTPLTFNKKNAHSVKKVHRHLRNGDMLLLNRQPTLHKPSIMAHKAKVLPGEKTLRLHYANCKSYNADFDGDEMNAHFPQSVHGQAECHHIANVNHQYLVPKDGTPLSGLIQDHIIAGTLLTIRGRFFPKEDYHQLLYSAISFRKQRLKLLPPCIIKPQQLWSGKQIVSSLIINLIPEGKPPLSLEGKTKVPSKSFIKQAPREWKAGGTPLKGDRMSEGEVVISSGELLCGIIDKAQIGPTPYSLIHCCYELYGGETSTLLLTALARLFTHYLQYHSGFSLGIEDIVLTSKATTKREKVVKKSRKSGKEACCRAFDIDAEGDNVKKNIVDKYKDAHFSRDDTGLKILDGEMKEVTDTLNNAITEICIPDGLLKKFPSNNLQLMVLSGAKGSSVNAMQISCLLGQIELEGRRMPLMMNGGSLPSFMPYDTSPRAGGFVAGRFLTGINQQEYFFHCMAGREGLIDTAVKTSRSGYLQRCLIKHLEGVMVNYDLTVRDSDGSVIQFLYGEDGLDVLKMQMLKENSLHMMIKNYDAAMNETEVAHFVSKQESDPSYYKKKIVRWNKKYTLSSAARQSPFLLYGSKQEQMAARNMQERKTHLEQGFRLLTEEDIKKYKKKIKKCPDPVNSHVRPDAAFGSISEKLDTMISEYVSKNPHGMLCEDSDEEEVRVLPDGKNLRKRLSQRKFKDMMYYRAIRSLAEPGEAVGLLAAQSVGEPSTQMTLNTFHFAGKGEMNVTLGIPRLREILMTASPNIATPTMDLPLLDKPGIEKKAKKLRVLLSHVALKDVMDSVDIVETIVINSNFFNCRTYSIKMKFLGQAEYKNVLNTTPSQILSFVEKTFLKRIVDVTKKKINISSTYKLVGMGKSSEKSSNKADDNEFPDNPPEAAPKDDGESSEESDGDGDTVSANSKNRHEQEQEYEDPEGEEMVPESDNENCEDVEETAVLKKEIESDRDLSDTESIDNSNRHISMFDKNTRIMEVKGLHPWICDYDFDAQNEKWCKVSLQLNLEGSKIDMKSLVEEEINKAYVYAIPQIQEALLVKNPKAAGKMMLKTKGVNFLEIFKHNDVIDINKIYSNNIHKVAETYGIEAAARVIMKEIVNVFGTYGIEVDQHHLSLLADYMTSSGIYRPCNRIGMESNASPLQQMTFETTKNYMVEAMLMGAEDKLKSPSASIVLGQLVGSGTGCFSLISKGKFNS